MIIAMDETIRIEGDRNDVLSECTGILHAIYEILVEKEGVDAANEQFVEIGRLAVMSEEDLENEINRKLSELMATQ